MPASLSTSRLDRDGGPRLPFIAAKMAHGDRLGHSWRAGRLLFPGLASDFARMIRAALALHEATGERALSRTRARLAGARSTATTPIRITAAISSPPTMPKAWWCAERDHDDATPNPNAIAAQNLVRLAAFTGEHAWRDQADRLFDGVLSRARARTCSATRRCSTRSTCACAPPKSWLRAGARADELRAAALGCHSSIVSCCARRARMRCRRRIRHATRSRRARCSVRLPRRALLPARHGAGPCCGGRAADERNLIVIQN